MDEKLLGKCGFYCGCCPTYIKGGCKGCVDEHSEGDCYPRLRFEARYRLLWRV